MGLACSCFKQQSNQVPNENVHPSKHVDSASGSGNSDNLHMERKMHGYDRPPVPLKEIFQVSIPDRERIPPPVIFRSPLRNRSWKDPFLPITVSRVKAGHWATSFHVRCEMIKDKMNGPLMISETEIKEDGYRCGCKVSSEYISDVTDERVTSDEWCESSPGVCKKCYLERVEVGHCSEFSSDWITSRKMRKPEDECFPSVYARIKMLESFRTKCPQAR